MSNPDPSREDIAVIGLAGRFPGARSLDEFWRNLRDGVESITSFSDWTIRLSRTVADRPARYRSSVGHRLPRVRSDV